MDNEKLVSAVEELQKCIRVYIVATEDSFQAAKKSVEAQQARSKAHDAVEAAKEAVLNVAMVA